MELRARKDQASQLFARGKFEKAAEAYAKLIELEPGDPQLRVRHAEACRRLGRVQHAISSYRSAAELLANRGYTARAQAALKMALELAPQNAALQEALRSLPHRAAPRVEGTPHERPRAITLETIAVSPADFIPPPPSAPEPPPSSAQTGGMEVRILSEGAIALRTSPTTPWLLLRSDEPIRLSVVEHLEREELSRGFEGELLPEEEFRKLYGPTTH